MEILTNYGIIVLNFINDHFTLIFAIIYAIVAIYFQYRYYKEKRKNIVLKASLKTCKEIYRHDTEIDRLKIESIEKESKITINDLCDRLETKDDYIDKLENQVFTKEKEIIELDTRVFTKNKKLKTLRIYLSKYKRYFYSYDRARNLFFGKYPAGKVFYNKYLSSKKLSLKKLHKDFENNRKAEEKLVINKK